MLMKYSSVSAILALGNELAELDENPDGELVNTTEVVKAKSWQNCRSIEIAVVPLKITVHDLKSN